MKSAPFLKHKDIEAFEFETEIKIATKGLITLIALWSTNLALLLLLASTKLSNLAIIWHITDVTSEHFDGARRRAWFEVNDNIVNLVSFMILFETFVKWQSSQKYR